jgi:hypothetical protein
MLRAAVLALALVGLYACASGVSEAGGGRDCFRGDSVRGFSLIDDRHVAISVGASRRYILTTMWNASALDWERAIALRSATGFICVGSGPGVEVYGGDPPRRFPITSVEAAPEAPAN